MNELEHERHADRGDEARQIAETTVAQGTAAIKARLTGEVRDLCEDCEQPIPPERQRLCREKNIPATRCARCQELHERDNPEYHGLYRRKVTG